MVAQYPCSVVALIQANQAYLPLLAWPVMSGGRRSKLDLGPAGGFRATPAALATARMASGFSLGAAKALRSCGFSLIGGSLAPFGAGRARRAASRAMVGMPPGIATTAF